MKTSTKKTLFLIGGILLILNILGSIIGYFALISSPEFIEYFLILSEIEYTAAELTNIYNAFIVIFGVFQLISVILTIIFAVVYFRKSGYTAEQFAAKKTSGVIVSVVVMLLISFIPGVLGLIASVSSSADEPQTVQPTQHAEQSPQEVHEVQVEAPTELQAKIEQLKKLKASGAISEEEYEQLFSSLIK